MSKAVVNGLRTRGVDVLTCQEADMLSASDEEQLEYATQNESVIFTHDTDFLRIHATGMEHAGIVYSGNQENIGGNIRNLKLIYDVMDASEMKNHVEYI